MNEGPPSERPRPQARRIRRSLTRLGPALLVAAVMATWFAGCGVDLTTPDSPGTGRICYEDSDCVPDGCCGRATSAIHVEDAPDCSQVQCDGECPVDQIDCGCGLPVCIDSHCTVAVTTGPDCPGLRELGER